MVVVVGDDTPESRDHPVMGRLHDVVLCCCSQFGEVVCISYNISHGKPSFYVEFATSHGAACAGRLNGGLIPVPGGKGQYMLAVEESPHCQIREKGCPRARRAAQLDHSALSGLIRRDPHGALGAAHNATGMEFGVLWGQQVRADRGLIGCPQGPQRITVSRATAPGRVLHVTKLPQWITATTLGYAAAAHELVVISRILQTDSGAQRAKGGGPSPYKQAFVEFADEVPRATRTALRDALRALTGCSSVDVSACDKLHARSWVGTTLPVDGVLIADQPMFTPTCRLLATVTQGAHRWVWDTAALFNGRCSLPHEAARPGEVFVLVDFADTLSAARAAAHFSVHCRVEFAAVVPPQPFPCPVSSLSCSSPGPSLSSSCVSMSTGISSTPPVRVPTPPQQHAPAPPLCMALREAPAPCPQGQQQRPTTPRLGPATPDPQPVSQAGTDSAAAAGPAGDWDTDEIGSALGEIDEIRAGRASSLHDGPDSASRSVATEGRLQGSGTPQPFCSYGSWGGNDQNCGSPEHFPSQIPGMRQGALFLSGAVEFFR